MCQHLWTYRDGRSRCLRCGQAVDDARGLPHGHYAINGMALTPGRLQAGYACPICLKDINPRVVDGKLRVLCTGHDAHDIVALGWALPKRQRDAILARQKEDFYIILDGLPSDLQEIIRCQFRA